MNNRSLLIFIKNKKHLVNLFFIIILTLIMTFIVYITGGTAFAFTHLMYIPIIISAYLFDVKGAVVTAFLCGITIGPLMPLNVSEKTMQEPISWIFRMIIFIIIGLVVAFLFRRIKAIKKNEIENSYQNLITGLPNVNKLNLALEEIIDTQESFSLLAFRIINTDDINRFVDFDIGIKSILKAVEILTKHVNDLTVYSVFTNEFAVILPESSIENARLIGSEFLNEFKEPISIDGFFIELIVKGSIVNYPLQAKEPKDMLKKMGIALVQESDESGLSVYNISVDKRNKERYEIMISLFEAIKNNEFYLVYQPKISLADNSVMGVEALLRWNNSIKGQMGTGEFIKIAEDIGIISEITKWIIKNSIDQIKKWQAEGVSIKVSINISAKDLRNNYIIEYMKNYIEESEIEPSLLEIELTERSIVKNKKITEYLLNDIREFGIKVSLDDFGTGYNSLSLVKLPIDYIKIDKTFIDNIYDHENRILIEGIVDFAHNTEKRVIAEGVESKEQIKILNSIGCDYIQGYYFSKPLPPEEIKNFILSFANDQVRECF